MQSTQKQSAMGGLVVGFLIGLGLTIIYYLVKAKNAVTTTAKNTLTALTGSLSDIPTHETASVEFTAAQTDAVLKTVSLNPVRLYVGEDFEIPSTLTQGDTAYIRVTYKDGVFFKVMGHSTEANTPAPAMPVVPSGTPISNIAYSPMYYNPFHDVTITTEQQVIDLLYKKKDYILSRIYLDKDEHSTGGAEAFVVYTDGTSKRLPVVDYTKKGLPNKYNGYYGQMLEG